MPKFQVTCKELAYVSRTYEIDTDTAQEAFDSIKASKGGDNMIDEQLGDGYEFCSAECVHDEDGNEIKINL